MTSQIMRIIPCMLVLLISSGCSSAATKVGDSFDRSSCISPVVPETRQTAPPAELMTPLNASIVSNFAIFRRMVSVRDEPSPDALAGRTLQDEIVKDYKLSSYYPAYVRQIYVGPRRHQYFVIVGFGRPELTPRPRCSTNGARREFVEQQRRRLIEPVYCVMTTFLHVTEPTFGCEPFSAVIEGGALFGSAVLAGQQIVEIVPDGVASIRLSYRGRGPINVAVHENAFVFESPGVPANMRSELNRFVGN